MYENIVQLKLPAADGKIIANFYEHFQLYVETAIEDGTLLEDLKAQGWKIKGSTLIQPSFNDLFNTKEEFLNLLEGPKEFERVNAKLSIPDIEVV